MGKRIALKRVYESVAAEDGLRVLVDRLWPRGIAKGDERIHKWCKDVAPSNELRKWFHQSDDFSAFAEKYRRELREDEKTHTALKELAELTGREESVTLVFASKEGERNNAIVLQQVLSEMMTHRG